MSQTAPDPAAALTPIGAWRPGDTPPQPGDDALRHALSRIHRPVYVVGAGDTWAVATSGTAILGPGAPSDATPLYAYAPPCPIERLGDAGFCADYGLRYPYVGGSMANGISSVAMVKAFAEAGLLGFFGAGGLGLTHIEQAVVELQDALGATAPWGVNLIHSPNEPAHEAAVAELLIRRRVTLIEASAFIDLTLPLVRYRVHGIHRTPNGAIITPHRVIAKVSRAELAAKFFAPPPERFLAQLVDRGEITREQAELAAHIPMAQDVTAEADSGGHTDNRPAIGLLPTLAALRDRIQAEHGYAMPLRLGLAGGIATPASAAAAFAMGAAYVLTGSVNQACVEAGSSDVVRKLLAEAGQADTIMAPAADMFEMGVNVQVLKRGTMFAMRAAKLYDLFRAYDRLEAIPDTERTRLEKTVFRASFDDVWRQTQTFFQQRDPAQLDRAAKDPKHKMALVFRWYLGQASHWANRGDAARQVDYQIWCGPAMGAFNEWAQGSHLEAPEQRDVVAVALNLLHGAAVVTRINALRRQGLPLSPTVRRIAPQPRAAIEECLR